MSQDTAAQLTPLAYHDYVALVAYLVEPLAVRLHDPPSGKPGDIHTNIRHEFADACHQYGHSVEAHAKKYAVANPWDVPIPGRPQPVPNGTAGQAPSPADRLAPFLYNPAFWVAFGRADAVSVVVFDDTDAMISVMAQASSSINQGTLAFCPIMDAQSLGFPNGLGEAQGPRINPFVDLHELLSERPPSQDDDHEFQSQTPLLVLTRFKMGGIGILAGGLTFQHAVFRTAAQQVCNELSDLSTHAAKPKLEALEITSRDLNAVRCTLLDGQGAEDLLLLTVCTNYSVGVALAARLRCMTIQHVMDTNPGLKRFLDNRQPHLLDSLAQLAKRTEPDRGTTKWATNHVFSDSYTNLAVANSIRLDPNRMTTGDQSVPVISGHVQALPQGDANPGHLQEVEKVLQDVDDWMRTEAAANRWPLFNITPASDYHRYLSGRHDFFVPVGRRPDEPLPTVQLRDYLTYLNRVLEQVKSVPAYTERPETGLMDFSSSLVVPFVNGVPLPRVNHEKHLPLMGMLDDLRTALFANTGQTGCLSIKNLKDTTRRLRTPWSLCGALELHYQRFREQLADPQLFDAVLDLYDVYATLYAFVTDFLPQVQAQARAANNPSTLFGRWLCERLSTFLVAIGNAADHRARFPLPDADRQDTAVDLRGGLSKLVAAADVPLKYGLLLVNRAIGRVAGSSAPGELPYDRVAGVTLFTFDPQTLCVGLRTSDPTPRGLIYVSMDVSHVFRPIRLLAHLHEAAHLVPRFTTDVRGHYPGRPDLVDMIDELYAELLTHLMVFGNDTDLYLKQHVAGYATSPQGQGSSEGLRDEDHIAHERFYRHMLIAFLVTEPIRRFAKGTLSKLSREGLHELLMGGNRAGVADAFLNIVERFGPLHERFAHWRTMQDFDSIWRGLFIQDLDDGAESFAAAWASSFDRFRTHGKDIDRSMSFTVGRAMLSGQPVIHPHSANHDRVDEVVQLVCQLLYAHAKFCFQSLNPSIGVHLPRGVEDGVVDFSKVQPPGNRWNVFQLDATHGGLFCVDPTVRRARLGIEVVILKSLWDISTHIRAERLDYLIRSLGLLATEGLGNA